MALPESFSALNMLPSPGVDGTVEEEGACSKYPFRLSKIRGARYLRVEEEVDPLGRKTFSYDCHELWKVPFGF